MKKKLIKPKFKAFRVGPLPANAINSVMDTELEVADVWVSKIAHQHIALDHPDDYDAFRANIIDIVRSPMWVGQDPKHGENFYLVSRVKNAVGEALLVAIGLEPNTHGTYNVRSAYSIDQADIDSRRMYGTLKAMPFK